MQPYGPVARCGDLIVFEVKEFKCRDIFRQDIASLLFQHGGENDAMKNNVILSNEV